MGVRIWCLHEFHDCLWRCWRLVIVYTAVYMDIYTGEREENVRFRYRLQVRRTGIVVQKQKGFFFCECVCACACVCVYAVCKCGTQQKKNKNIKKVFLTNYGEWRQKICFWVSTFDCVWSNYALSHGHRCVRFLLGIVCVLCPSGLGVRPKENWS